MARRAAAMARFLADAPSRLGMKCLAPIGIIDSELLGKVCFGTNLFSKVAETYHFISQTIIPFDR